MENLIKIKQDWQQKLKNAKTEQEKNIILRRLQKIENELDRTTENFLENNRRNTDNLTCAVQPDCEKVYYFSEKLQEKFYWDKSSQTVVFDSGPVYSEEEIRDLHLNDNIDNIMLKCVHEIKRSFPQTKWIKTVELTEQVSQEDELDLLFKDLKG